MLSINWPRLSISSSGTGNSQREVQVLAGLLMISTMNNIPKLRVARPTDNLAGLMNFYRDGLGLAVLSRFENHEGFDGVMLGHPGAPYHFEFTHAHGHSVGRAPTQDNLLILYIADRTEWETAVHRMQHAGFQPVPAFNPYWDRNGVTFEDPDGYRIVLQNAAWDR
jgi:catechol 2,3-dioxygenase-like lactoylglutathione lyase family enzyme